MTEPVARYGKYEGVSFLVHGESKTGKSSLSATAPKPLLVLDAEGSWNFMPVNMIFWDPQTETPPVYDGTWDVCKVVIRDWSTVEQVMGYLNGYALPFVSVVLDSLNKIQDYCKDNLTATTPMTQEKWGILLSRMNTLVRDLADMRMNKNMRCLVMVTESKLGEDNRWAPSLQGQFGTSAPFGVDICGYLYPDMEVDANQNPVQEVRRLWVGHHPQYVSGERVRGRLGHYQTVVQEDPEKVGSDIATWMDTIHGIPTNS